MHRFRWIVLVAAVPAAALAARTVEGDPWSLLPDPRTAVWLESSDVKNAKNPLAGAMDVAVGDHHAIVVTAGGYVVLRDTGGAFGPLRVPEGTAWVGFGRGDRILAATAAGELFAAPGPEAAVAGQFQAKAQVPGAVSWDAAGEVIAAVTKADVRVSIDGGASFRTSSPASGAVWRQVVARPDGLVLVSGDQTDAIGAPALAMVSRDAGGTWTKVQRPQGQLVRTGQWVLIRGDSVRALDADGRGWVEGHAFLGPLEARQAWSDRLALATVPSGTDEEARLVVTNLDPPLPREGATRTARAIDGASGAQCPGPTTTRQGCEGLTCMVGSHGPLPPPTRYEYRLLNDGTCKGADGAKCCPDDRFVRVPDAIVIDRAANSFRIVPLPDGCDPVALHSAGGIGVLRCRAGVNEHIRTLDKSGVWHDEGAAPTFWGHESPSLEMAADGTLLLQTPCTTECKALVRAPVELGTADAWRLVKAPRGALAWRAGPGGSAIAARATTATRLELFVYRIDAPVGRAVLDVPITENAFDFQLDHHRLLVRVVDTEAKDGTADYVLNRDGWIGPGL